MAPIYDRSAPRKAVNLSINEDLLARAKMATRNLSGTVEELLAGFIQNDEARKRAEDTKLIEVLDALATFHDQHGFMSDEFSNLG